MRTFLSAIRAIGVLLMSIGLELDFWHRMAFVTGAIFVLSTIKPEEA